MGIEDDAHYPTNEDSLPNELPLEGIHKKPIVGYI